MRLSQFDRATIIAGLDRIEQARQAILDVLLPEDDEPGEAPACTHPDDRLIDESTLGDERYVCTACGAAFSQHPRSLTPEE